MVTLNLTLNLILTLILGLGLGIRSRVRVRASFAIMVSLIILNSIDAYKPQKHIVLVITFQQKQFLEIRSLTSFNNPTKKQFLNL